MEIFSPWWQLVLALIALAIFIGAIHKSQRQQFYSDTFWLTPLGVFVWGDGLILGPFWFFSSLLFLWLSPLSTLRYVLVFFSLRSAYEVIFWINHQVVNKDYSPPLFRRFTWLKPQESAILYQLLNTCEVVVLTVALLLTFTGR